MIRSVATVLTATTMLLVTGLAVADPCDSRDPASAPPAGYLPPPHSLEQLREYLVPGLEVLVRVESPVLGSFSRLLRIESTDATGLVMVESTVEAPMRRQMPDNRIPLSWEEFRDQACFPAGPTSRERTTLSTAFGELKGWTYSYQEGDVAFTLAYADEFPGIPMEYRRVEAGMVLLTSRQIDRSDAPIPEIEENPLIPEI